MKKFFAEFKEFMSKGNVIDMAVGVVVGAAFKAIIDSLVKDIIMPVVGWLLGGIDFSSFVITLQEAREVDGELLEAVTINYGVFINSIISFVIIGFCLFCVVKLVNALRRKKEEEPAPEPEEPKPSVEELLLTEIRDILKEKND